ncbi:MAG: hypothetical protein CM15mP12_0690 [Gammaproteobacteria bacterium]|nr:MAG: hypothetical protein CM15mP12_0690 [Gammaproteobacteria bacterium]
MFVPNNLKPAASLGINANAYPEPCLPNTKKKSALGAFNTVFLCH